MSANHNNKTDSRRTCLNDKACKIRKPTALEASWARSGAVNARRRGAPRQEDRAGEGEAPFAHASTQHHITRTFSPGVSLHLGTLTSLWITATFGLAAITSPGNAFDAACVARIVFAIEHNTLGIEHEAIGTITLHVV